MGIGLLKGFVFIVVKLSFCIVFYATRPTYLCGFTSDSNVVTVVG